MIAADDHGKEPMLARMGQKLLSIGAVERLTGLALWNSEPKSKQEGLKIYEPERPPSRQQECKQTAGHLG